jgi:tetratricopeptide (TPR) repeat protein
MWPHRWGSWIIGLVVLLALGTLAAWFVRSAAEAERRRETRSAIAKARSWLQSGRADLALRTVRTLPQEGPQAAEALAVRGLALAALDRPEEARPYLERALALDPRQPMAAKTLAAVYFSANEGQRGFHMLEHAARLDPGDFRPWYAAGTMALRQSYPPEKAIAAFREALRRQPDHDESRIGLIEALLASGSAEEATPWLLDVLRERPRDPAVLYLAALHARQVGRPEEADRYLALALEADPNQRKALILRAQSFHRAGRRQEALELAERAVALDPNDASALSLLAQVEAALGLSDRAAATSTRHREVLDLFARFQRLRESVDQHPDDPRPRCEMGRVAARAGMTDLARSSFRAALALDPQCPDALRGLAELNGKRRSP